MDQGTDQGARNDRGPIVLVCVIGMNGLRSGHVRSPKDEFGNARSNVQAVTRERITAIKLRRNRETEIALAEF